MSRRAGVLLLVAASCSDPGATSEVDTSEVDTSEVDTTEVETASSGTEVERDAGPLAADPQDAGLAPFVPHGGGPIELGGDGDWDASACGRCHRREYRQWRASAHRRAFTNPLFRHEYGLQNNPACAACHAPLSSTHLDDGRAREGVGCAACHVREGGIVASRVSGRAPHPSRLEPRLADVRACEGCHDFDRPGRPGEPLQRTVHEWRQSRAGQTGVPCQGCHMQENPGRSITHALPGGHDPEMTGRALAVEASAHYEGRQTIVVLTLRSRAGHAVPTGDVFRRLSARAWPAGQRREEREIRFAGRSLRQLGDASEDDRVPPAGRGARTVELVLVGRHRSVRWRLDLLHLGVGRRPARGQLRAGELRVPMARGTVRIAGER